MKERKPFGQGFSQFSQGAVALFALVIFAFLSIAGLIQTCHVDIDLIPKNNEHVSYINDNILINVLAIAAILLLSVLLIRARVKRKTVFWVTAVAAAVNLAIGVWWVLSAHALPSADSEQIIAAAQRLIQGDPNALSMTDYFKIYPYQTGFLLYAEGMLRLFGANQLTLFQLTNPVFVCMSVIATVMIARELFDDARVELLSAIFAALAFQPAFLSTFLYGTLPGMAMAIWSVYFTIRAIRSGKLHALIPAGALIVLAIVLKKNFWIVLIAECVMTVLSVLKNKKALLLIGIACMIAVSSVLPGAVQSYYETRTGQSFGKGTPQMAWLVTGFRDSSLAPGWYNGYTNNVLRDNDFDYEKTLTLNKADFLERALLFASRPIYLASFFYYKITSQWNEPEFQSIWSSATADASSVSAPVSDFVFSLGRGDASDAIHEYFNQLMQFVYIGMTISFWVLLKKKEERREERLIVPLILVGAAVYHALFEAKAQYAIIYIPMMLPYAAFGVKAVADRMFRKSARQEQARETVKE